MITLRVSWIILGFTAIQGFTLTYTYLTDKFIIFSGDSIFLFENFTVYEGEAENLFFFIITIYLYNKCLLLFKVIFLEPFPSLIPFLETLGPLV